MTMTAKACKTIYILLTTAAILLIAATSCEYLEETAPATLLPNTDQIIQEARKYNQSPMEVLDRHYTLKKAQLEAKYQRDITKIEDQLNDDTITTTIADKERNMTKLKWEQQQLQLELLYKQRKTQLEREKERFNR